MNVILYIYIGKQSCNLESGDYPIVRSFGSFRKQSALFQHLLCQLFILFNLLIVLNQLRGCIYIRVIFTILENNFQQNRGYHSCQYNHNDNRAEKCLIHQANLYALAGDNQSDLPAGYHADADAQALNILISAKLGPQTASDNLCQNRQYQKQYREYHNAGTHFRQHNL